MSVPTSWRRVDIQGIDSAVEGFITPNKDTMITDYGWHSNPYEEVIEVRSMQRKTEYDSVGFHYPSTVIFSESAALDESQAIHMKEYFFYEKIDGRKAKIGFPKLIGRGRCLIHFPNVGSGKNKLSIDITCKDSITQRQVYEAFKSIKFHKNK